MQLVTQESKTPTRKMAAVANATLALTAVFGLLAAFGVEVPSEIRSGIVDNLEGVFALAAAVSGLVQFAAGWWTKERAPEGPVVETRLVDDGDNPEVFWEVE